MLDNKVIRICGYCKSIYIDNAEKLDMIQLCRFCERPTGFFESLRHFYRHIDIYGIDTDDIKNKELQSRVMKDYNVVNAS